MTRTWTAIVLGGALVGIAKVLAHYDLATPIPFWLLLPGILTGACVPGSGFNLKDDTHWSPLSVFVFYAVNIALQRLGLSAALPSSQTLPSCKVAQPSLDGTAFSVYVKTAGFAGSRRIGKGAQDRVLGHSQSSLRD
jgi:hypothetical protein